MSNAAYPFLSGSMRILTAAQTCVFCYDMSLNFLYNLKMVSKFHFSPLKIFMNLSCWRVLQKLNANWKCNYISWKFHFQFFSISCKKRLRTKFEKIYFCVNMFRHFIFLTKIWRLSGIIAFNSSIATLRWIRF